MGAALLPVLSGVAGLFLQQDSNRRAQNTADEARKKGDALTDRQIAAYDRLTNEVTGMDSRGEFDAGNAVNRYGRDVEIGADRAGSALAGASRVAGFKAGDSPISQGLQGISDGAALDYARGSEQIRTDSRNRKLDAYGAASGAGTGLNSAIGRYSNQEANAINSQSGLGGAISSIAAAFPMKAATPKVATAAPQTQNMFQMAPTTLDMPDPVTFDKNYNSNVGLSYKKPKIKGIRY